MADNLFEGFFVPNLGFSDDDDAPFSGWKKEDSKETEDIQSKNNQGRDTCFRCGAKTIKVDTGMFSVYDICPKCRI